MASAQSQSSKDSSVFKPAARNVKELTRLFLYVQAGGRCEFDGHNHYLLEHYPTETVGNFAEMAHIYAFKPAAARGDAEGRPPDAEIDNLDNLILLCPGCHKLVDVDRPLDFPVEVLRKFKKDHEDRVHDLTGLSKDRDTVPFIIRGRIADRDVQISDDEMQAAVAPKFLKRRDKAEVDLTNLQDGPADAYLTTAKKEIDRKIVQLHETRTRPGRSLQVSVFALARVPLLIYAGSRLSDKVHVDLYQRHRLPVASWTWREGDGSAQYQTRRIADGADEHGVAFLVNLSGANTLDILPQALKGIAGYELTLKDAPADQLFLNCRGDLERFRAEFMRAMAAIRKTHPKTPIIHLFPAVPAPVAVAIGLDRLPNADPPFLIYDRDKDAGGFVPTLEVK